MILEITEKERQWLLDNLKGSKEAEAIRRKAEKVHKIKPRSAKNKGLGWQKEIAELVSRITGFSYNQGDDDCLIHSRESGLNGTDVILRGKAKEIFDYAIECKASENISLPDWVRQAKQNSVNDNWLLFVKNRNLGKMAIMPLDTFEKEFKKNREIN